MTFDFGWYLRLISEFEGSWYVYNPSKVICRCAKEKKRTVLSIQGPVHPFHPTAVSLSGRSHHHISSAADLGRLIGTRWPGYDKYRMAICFGRQLLSPEAPEHFPDRISHPHKTQGCHSTGMKGEEEGGERISNGRGIGVARMRGSGGIGSFF